MTVIQTRAVDRRRNGEFIRTLSTAARTRRGAIGLSLAILVFAIAFLGPLFAPYSATALVGQPFAGPTSGHILGMDVLGRDVLSRVLCGGRVLLLMAIASTLVTMLLGVSAGIAAAHMRGLWDGMIMRGVDVLLAFPQLVFALLLVSLLGPEKWLIIIAIALAQSPQVARVIRSAALDVSERDFVQASEALGIARPLIMLRDILPNVTAPLMVEAGLRLTYSIIFIAGLSFLGLGQQPPAPDWGVMINENRLGLTANPLSVVVPAIIIGVLTVGINTFTDAVARASSLGSRRG